MAEHVGSESLSMTNADRAHSEMATNWRVLRGFSIKGTGTTIELREAGPDLPAAPAAALADPAAPGNVNDGAHDYALTFATADGETPESPLTVVTVANKTVNGQVTVTVPAITDDRITSVWIYRSAAAAHVLKRLHEVTTGLDAEQVYTDNTADSGLVNTQPPVTNGAGALLRTVTDSENEGPWAAGIPTPGRRKVTAILTAGAAATAAIYGTDH